jgi:hypothetical protein
MVKNIIKCPAAVPAYVISGYTKSLGADVVRFINGKPPPLTHSDSGILFPAILLISTGGAWRL